MLQLVEAFSGSTQLSTKVNLGTFLKNIEKTNLPKYKFKLDLLFPNSPADKNQVSASELNTNISALE